MWDSTITARISKTKITAGWGTLFPTRSTVSRIVSSPVFFGAIGCILSTLALSAMMSLPPFLHASRKWFSRAEPSVLGRGHGTINEQSGNELGFQHFSQRFFVVLAQRGLENFALTHERFQTLKHLVGSRFLDQNEQRGRARLERISNVFHHLVIQANVAEFTRERAGAGADGHAQKRVEKKQADEHAPEAAGDRARSRQAHRLMQLGLAIFVSSYDDGVLHLQQILLLHFCQRCAHFERSRLILKHHGYECAHFFPFMRAIAEGDGVSPASCF